MCFWRLLFLVEVILVGRVLIKSEVLVCYSDTPIERANLTSFYVHLSPEVLTNPI